MAKSTITVDTADGVDPFSVYTSRSKRSKVREFANLLRAMAGHALKGHPSIRAGTAQASGTVTAAAVQAADTVSINGTALTATTHTARGTATLSTAVEDDTLTVGDVTFTLKDTPDPEEPLEVEVGATDADTAANLVAAINANEDLAELVVAVQATAVVHIRALTAGTGGNSIALEETGDGITVSGAGTLAGGAAVANNQFDFWGVDNDFTASEIARAMEDSTTALVSGQVVPTVADAVVTVKAKTKGTPGNAITIASSNGSRLAVTPGARLTGGTDSTLTF